MDKITNYKSQMVSMRKNITGIERIIRAISKIQQSGQIITPFSKDLSYRNGYYGTYADGVSTFIGNPEMLSYFKDWVKPHNLSVKDAYLSFATSQCSLLDCNVTEWYKNYLHSLAEETTHLPVPINSLTEDELSFDSLVVFTPTLSADALKEFIREHVSKLLQFDLQHWCHSSAVCPTIPLEPEEVALRAYNFELHNYVYSLMPPKESQEIDKLILLLKPTEHFCNWLAENNEHLSHPAENPQSYDLSLLRAGCSAIVIPYLPSQLHADEFFAANYTALFECELNAWCENKQYWPTKRSLGHFTDWFDFDYHDTALTFPSASSKAEQRIS